jgi:nucleoside transporter
VSSWQVLKTLRKAEYAELIALFFLQWMAYGAWLVPLTLVLRAHGFAGIQPYAFATTATAAFVSPLFFGAIADRHVAPARVLRWLALATAAALCLCCVGIHQRWNQWLVLGLIQLQALCQSPATSISSTLVLSSIRDPRVEFGPIRAMGTIGWMGGCLLVSLLNADSSTLAGFSSAALWFGLAVFSFFLPNVEPSQTGEHLSWRQRLGLDALTLLRNRDHRVVYLTTLLLCIPLAAFYPFTPSHLKDLGFNRPSAWMSLAQTTEIVAMFSLGALLVRGRLKWIFAAGLFFSALRFAFCALNEKAALIVGIVLHGCTYTFVYTTAQIYVNERVEARWRARAQALLTLLNSGVGNLIGYLGTGWWFMACTERGVTRWPLFWSVIAAACGLVLIYFLASYRGIGPRRDGMEARDLS